MLCSVALQSGTDSWIELVDGISKAEGARRSKKTERILLMLLISTRFSFTFHLLFPSPLIAPSVLLPKFWFHYEYWIHILIVCSRNALVSWSLKYCTKNAHCILGDVQVKRFLKLTRNLSVKWTLHSINPLVHSQRSNLISYRINNEH